MGVYLWGAVNLAVNSRRRLLVYSLGPAAASRDVARVTVLLEMFHDT